MKAGRAFAVVIGASGLLAGLLLWPRFNAPEHDSSPLPPSSRAARSVSPTGASSSATTAAATGIGGGGAGASAGTGGAAAHGSDAGEAALPEPVPAYVRTHPETGQGCPVGMALVEGVYCPFVAHRCEQPRSVAPGERCDRFGTRFICEGKPVALHFCIDRYEYPNQRGVRPVILVSYTQAAEACRTEGKRLCDSEQWAMACEGPGTWPYPTGLTRDGGACNVDQPDHTPDPRALADPRQLSIEMERLDGRTPSGARPACVSRWGIYDMAGNVREWVWNRRGDRRGKTRASALAGGDWGQGPAACRTLDSSYGEGYRAPAVGFRCCAEPLDGHPARRSLPKGVRLGRKQRVLGPDELPEPSAPQASAVRGK